MYYIAIPFVDFVLKAVISKVETQISEQLLIYGFLCIISTLLNHWANLSVKSHATELMVNFEKEQVDKYDRMDKTSKEKSTFSAFTEKLTRAKWAINAKYTWGMMCISSVVSSLVGFCYIVMVNKQYVILFVFFLVHGLWYYFITKDMMKTINDKRQSNRKERSRLYDIVHLLGVRFHNGECSSSDLLEKKVELHMLETGMDGYWSLVTTLQALPNYIVIISIALFVDKTLYLVLYLICNNLTNSISNALGFMNQYNTFQDDLKRLEEFWDDKCFEKEYDQYDIPDIFTLSGFLSEFLTVTYLTIKQGDAIIISGLSGAGKTTLIKGLIGYIPGIVLSTSLHPLSYRKKIMYMCQDARGNVPTSKPTVRELFYGETNDVRIIDSLETVELTTWYIDVLHKNLDLPIEEKISGGQKTRLCLAITLYKARKENVKWLILDEPDSGLDPELSPKLLKKVLSSYKDMTIFLIVHMCECKLRELSITTEWRVEDSQVKCIKRTNDIPNDFKFCHNCKQNMEIV